MGTTSDGYPYPEGTDMVMDGDDAIKALAEALTKRTYILLDNNARAASDAANTYPAGISVMAITSGGPSDWPAGSGLVVTQRFFTDRVQQTFYVTSSAASAYYRSTGGGNFGAWAGATAPYAEAAGSVAVSSIPPGNAGDSVTRTVTFPSGRFTATPDAVLLTVHTGVPNARSAGTGSITKSSFLLAAGNSGSSTASNVLIDWHAVQLTAASSALFAAPARSLDADDGLYIPAIATCHQLGCENRDIPVEIDLGYYNEETGEIVRIGGVTCGACGHDITDVQEVGS